MGQRKLTPVPPAALRQDPPLKPQYRLPPLTKSEPTSRPNHQASPKTPHASSTTNPDRRVSLMGQRELTLVPADVDQVQHDAEVHHHNPRFNERRVADELKQLERQIHAARNDPKPLRPRSQTPQTVSLDETNCRISECRQRQQTRVRIVKVCSGVEQDARVMAREV